MIASPNYNGRGGRAVRLVAIHTAEGALTAQALGNYFANPASQVSSHVGIDDSTLIQYVDYAYATWTMLSANPISDQAELCGFAAWSRETWLLHKEMLNQAAAWIRARCLARGIPIVKLTPAQVAAGQAGVCGHWDWTLGTGEGTHTDPGAGFPWDYVIQRAANPTPPAPPHDEESDMPFILKSTKYPNGVLGDGSGNYVGLSAPEFAALTGTAGDGSTLAVKWSWASDGTIDELLRLSRFGEDTPTPTHAE